MATSPSSSEPPNNGRENKTDDSHKGTELSKMSMKDRAMLMERVEHITVAMTMLHESSGRRNFSLMTTTNPILSCPAQVSNFLIRLKDQIKQAITLADKQEATTSALESVPK